VPFPKEYLRSKRGFGKRLEGNVNISMRRRALLRSQSDTDIAPFANSAQAVPLQRSGSFPAAPVEEGVSKLVIRRSGSIRDWVVKDGFEREFHIARGGISLRG
jgi:hypothetical protein